jgi:hypothetical protein
VVDGLTRAESSESNLSKAAFQDQKKGEKKVFF